MRKLIKLVGLAVGAGAVAYLMKGRLVPVPEGPTEEPPTSRVAPAAQPGDAPGDPHDGDDLTEVKGIGPVYAERLAQSGITTFAGLAATDAAVVAEAAGVTEDRAADWTSHAAQLAS